MKISKILYLFLTLALFTSCNDDDDLYPVLGSEPKNISEIVSETSNLATLASVLTQAGADETLQTTTTYTLFAPNNNAFSGDDLSSLSDMELQNVVSNHLISTVLADFASTMSTGYKTTLATGPDGNNLSFFTNATSDLIFNGVASLESGAFDIGATNGTIHTVDAVLMPPTIVDHAMANPEYSSLAQAIGLAGLTETLSNTDTENPNYPFTMFAPNNAAFESLMTELNGAFGWSSLSDVPPEVLSEILLYHVVAAENVVMAEIDGTTQTTLQGESFSISGTLIDDASYTNSGINLNDIQGINGIMHGIDRVLLPNTTFQTILDETLNIVERCNDKGYSTFTQAVEMAGLTASISSDDLTAFAPSNGAFEIFFLTIENYDSLSDFNTPEDIALLKNVVEYHLAMGEMMQSELTDGPLTTVVGDDFTIESGALVPSHEFAPAANISVANIGASNGIIHEIDNVLVSDADAAALGYPAPATGAPVYGYEIYHDELNPNYWVGGWAATDFASTDYVKSGLYSIKADITAGGYEGFQIGGGYDVNITEYTTVDFSVYSESGTTLKLVINEQWDGYPITVTAGEWNSFSIPLSSVPTGTNTAIDQFVLQDQSGNAGSFYIDQVGLDITFESAIPEFAYEVYTENNINADWIGGWTAPVFDSTSNPSTGVYSIEDAFAGWDGFQLGGTNIELSEYTVVKFSVYVETANSFKLVLNEQWDGYVIDPTPGEWNHYSIPLADVLYGTSTYTQFVIQENSGNVVTAYFDDIGFD